MISGRRHISLVLTYCKLWVFDMIDYYYAFLILSLPAFLFGPPIIKISQSEYSSDSEDELSISEYEVFITQLVFIMKSNESMTTRNLNGLQIRPLIDEKGRFFVGHIQRYYPNLDTIILSYVKFPAIQSGHSFLPEEPVKQTKVIDVVKRYDIRNKKSLKMGITF